MHAERTDRVEERRGVKFIRLKGGRLMTFWDAHTAVDRAYTALTTATSRAFKLADAAADRESREYDLERLDWLLASVIDYAEQVRKVIEEKRGVRTVEERIALLRNTTGRTPEESAAFTRKADELERRLRGGSA